MHPSAQSFWPHLPNPKFSIKVFLAVACPCSRPLVTMSAMHVSLHQSNWYFLTLTYTNQHWQHTFEKHLEKACKIYFLESFDNTLSHQGSTQNLANLKCPLLKLHSWGAADHWSDVRGNPQGFQREWKTIFSGWSYDSWCTHMRSFFFTSFAPILVQHPPLRMTLHLMNIFCDHGAFSSHPRMQTTCSASKSSSGGLFTEPGGDSNTKATRSPSITSTFSYRALKRHRVSPLRRMCNPCSIKPQTWATEPLSTVSCEVSQKSKAKVAMSTVCCVGPTLVVSGTSNCKNSRLTKRWTAVGLLGVGTSKDTFLLHSSTLPRTSLQTPASLGEDSVSKDIDDTATLGRKSSLEFLHGKNAWKKFQKYSPQWWFDGDFPVVESKKSKKITLKQIQAAWWGEETPCLGHRQHRWLTSTLPLAVSPLTPLEDPDLPPLHLPRSLGAEPAPTPASFLRIFFHCC